MQKRIEYVALPTKNRPEMLGRCLAHLRNSLHSSSRQLTVLIVDDSDTPQAEEANITVVNSYRRDRTFELRYANRHSRQSCVDILARHSGYSKHLIRFALLGGLPGIVSTGACRNALMLSAIRSCVLFLDDDINCQFGRVPGSMDEVLSASSPEQHFDTYFLPDLETARNMPVQVEDIVGLHERALNLESMADDGQTPNASLHRRTSDVAVSLTGVLGDSAANNQVTLLQWNDRTFERLIRTEDTYRSALLNRAVLRSATQFVVSKNLPCISYCMGVDNRYTTPPFAPLFRGQDHIFGTVLRQIDPTTRFCAIPRAIVHLPAQPRRFSPTHPFNLAGRLSSATILACLLSQISVPSECRATAMRALGQALVDITSQACDQRAAIVFGAVEPFVTELYRSLLDRINRYSKSRDDYWSKDVLRAATSFHMSLVDPTRIVTPYDSASADTIDGRPYAYREFLRDYGNLLMIWPAIVHASAELQLTRHLFINT